MMTKEQVKVALKKNVPPGWAFCLSEENWVHGDGVEKTCCCVFIHPVQLVNFRAEAILVQEKSFEIAYYAALVEIQKRQKDFLTVGITFPAMQPLLAAVNF